MSFKGTTLRSVSAELRSGLRAHFAVCLVLLLSILHSGAVSAQSPPDKPGPSRTKTTTPASAKANEFKAYAATLSITAFASVIEQAVAVEDASSLEEVCEFYRRDPRNTECPPPDPWGTPLRVMAKPGFSSYFVLSAMADKVFEAKPAMGLQKSLSRDIVYLDGAFVQFPPVVVEQFADRLKVVTAEEYRQLEVGMTEKQVRWRLEAPGTERSQSNIGGIVTVSYQWTNADGSSVIAIFQDGLLVSKAQHGL